MSNLRAEQVLNVLNSIVGILNNIAGDPIAEQIIQLRDAASPDGENPLLTSSDEERETGNYKDFSDLQARLGQAGGANVDIQPEAANYLVFGPAQENQFFEITIVGRSFGIVHKIVAVAAVAEGKVRYLRWQEDP